VKPGTLALGLFLLCASIVSALVPSSTGDLTNRATCRRGSMRMRPFAPFSGIDRLNGRAA